MADITSVHGIERAVIVVVPEVKPPRTVDTMYRTFCQSADNDEYMKEAVDASEGKDFSISAGGEYEKDDDHDDESDRAGDAETREMETGENGGRQDRTQPETVPARSAEEEEEEEASGREDEDGHNRDETDDDAGSSDDSQSASEAEDPSVPVEEKDPLTYADAYSEQQIRAALASLSKQSRKDIFYIGSRTVCQLILLHLGKDPPTKGSEDGTSGDSEMAGHAETSGDKETSGHAETSGDKGISGLAEMDGHTGLSADKMSGDT